MNHHTHLVGYEKVLFRNRYVLLNSFVTVKGLMAENDSQESNILNNVKLTVYDPSFCKNVFNDTLKQWDSQICCGTNVYKFKVK